VGDERLLAITNERELAYETGYAGNRALRTWQERMRLLEALGFIKAQKIGNEPYRYVLMVDPATVVAALAKKGRVDAAWLATYDARRSRRRRCRPPRPCKPSPPRESCGWRRRRSDGPLVLDVTDVRHDDCREEAVRTPLSKAESKSAAPDLTLTFGNGKTHAKFEMRSSSLTIRKSSRRPSARRSVNSAPFWWNPATSKCSRAMTRPSTSGFGGTGSPSSSGKC
jgi:hypothetical protein